MPGRQLFRLPRSWFVAAALVGVLAGVSAYTFHYAEGLSYFSTDPAACVNCHIMQPQYDSWQKASHHALATCVDCHLPEAGLAKWVSKADNGFVHSTAFTFQNFHEPIQIREVNRRVLENNCVRCHGDLVEDSFGLDHYAEGTQCVHCHRDVGHGPRAGLGGPMDWSRDR